MIAAQQEWCCHRDMSYCDKRRGGKNVITDWERMDGFLLELIPVLMGPLKKIGWKEISHGEKCVLMTQL